VQADLSNIINKEEFKTRTMEETLQHIAIRKHLGAYAFLTKNRKETITYSLTADDADSNAYYHDIAQFTDTVLAHAQIRLQSLVAQFKTYVQETGCESLRTSEEYILEALTLGVLWNVYAAHAMTCSPRLFSVFHHLIALRRRHRWLKPGVDRLRGILTTLCLRPRSTTPLQSYPWTAGQIDTFLNWLAVTGEFHEEVKRLRTWQRFFETLPSAHAANHLDRLIACAHWFQTQAQEAICSYTSHVEEFLQDVHPHRYRWREDMLFCGRREVEYHLIMVGAEILNRALRADFLRTPRKAVLLPTCMRSRSAVECRARKEGFDISCTGCSSNCRINQLTRLGKRMGFDVFMIPHSSVFSKWLERWRDTREVGVVGVACVLNLFTGGYEMKDLNIPSQCVLLDYCGCQNHWHSEGIPTDINQAQLLHILQTHTINVN
jgi:hypothetical protein